MSASVRTNFRSCCRLCLEEQASTLTNIFSLKNESQSLIERIYSVTDVKIATSDRISTNVCDKCFLLINNFDNFKNNCLLNQHKLKKLLNEYESSIFNESIQIKEEPPEEDDVVFVSSQDEDVTIKAEPAVGPLHVAIDGRDDLPPLLSPNLPIADLHAHLDEHDAIETCEVLLADSNDIDADAAPEQQEEYGQNSIQNENQQDKLEFAAGLQLQSRMDTINDEPMTKAEIEYSKRFALYYTSVLTRTCCCHNFQFPTKKSLLGHMKTNNIVLVAPYTCQGCFTACNGRTTLSRHANSCHRKDFENIYQVANTFERGINKHRSYQMFACMLCENQYRIFELYCQHIDEHAAEFSANTVCLCKRRFDNANVYKQHMYSSCVMKVMCDLCLQQFDTMHEFKQHCTESHDNTNGITYPVTSKFEIQELPFEAQYACVECNMKCIKEQFLINHLKITHSYDEENAKRVAADCNVARAGISDDRVDNSMDITKNEMSLSNSITTDTTLSELVMSVPKRTGDGLECEICNKVFAKKLNLRRHQQKVHFSSMKRYANIRCGDCNKSFPTVTILMNHLANDHVHTCEECGKAYDTPEELNKHRSSHLRLSLRLDPETQRYQSRPSNEGMPTLESCDEVDRKSLKIQCEICKRWFATSKGHKIHYKWKHPANIGDLTHFPKPCTICKVSISDASSLKLHMQMHSSDSNSASASDETDYVTCKKCFKVFARKSTLDRHMVTHSTNNVSPKNGKIFTCQYCKSSLISQSDLDKHIKKRHSQLDKDTKAGKYQCHICNKKLYSAESLRGHATWHKRSSATSRPPALRNETEEPMKVDISKIKSEAMLEKKTFVCITCGDLFPSQVTLQAHITKAHGRVTSIRCIICNKYFTNPNDFKEHERNHRKAAVEKASLRKLREFCKICQKTFIGRELFREHWEEKHPDEPFIPKGTVFCPYCKSNFMTPSALATHVLKHKRNGDLWEKPSTDYKIHCGICQKGFNLASELRSHLVAEHPF